MCETAGFEKPTSIPLHFAEPGSALGGISSIVVHVYHPKQDYLNTMTSHLIITQDTPVFGELVSQTGRKTEMNDLEYSEPIYEVTITSVPNDPTVLGSYLSVMEPEENLPEFHTTMAVGNGFMWVMDNGSNLKVGDYLISSGTPGHAMKESGVYEIAYIIGKVAEPVNWSEVEKDVSGIKHKMISVFFEQFIMNHKAENLEKEMNEKFRKLQEEIDDLKILLIQSRNIQQ